MDADKISDEMQQELLTLVRSEMQASIGFENDSDLIGQRELALDYSKGRMTDVPSLPNRSRAVSSDISDAVETAMPDLIEIFTNGEDVITFRPQGEEDEAQAEQETDYVQHVFFNENDGWRNLYTYIKDALQVKIGHLTWWWEEGEYPEPKVYEGQTPEQAQMLIEQAQGEVDYEIGEDGLIRVTVQEPRRGYLCIRAFDPNDFTICRDATCIEEATYCARRSRPRAQDLKAEGVDPGLVDALPTYDAMADNGAIQARDTVSESTLAPGGLEWELRQVYVVEHYIRLKRDGKTQIYQVLTDWECTKALRVAKVNRVNIAAGTPYINTHRFYGDSLADKLIEVQRIKTMLIRMTIDCGAFALNQRPGVDMSRVNEFTIADLLNNIPGSPIRTDGPPSEVIQMMGGPSLNYDPLEQLEYFSTVAEQRTGIVRNAQGLNPDTLHDTKGGAEMLANAALKRLRLIARCLADGLKDAYLGIHATLCENASAQQVVRLRNKWVSVSPSEWDRRNDMTIEIGAGAANGPHELMVAQTLGEVQQALVQAQGGINGPLANPESINATAVKMAKSLGVKNPEKYFPDPANYEPPQEEPPPDPALLKVQVDAQVKQAQHQLDTEKAVAEQENKEKDFDLRLQIAMAELNRKDAQVAAELAERQRQFDEQMAFEREKFEAEKAIERERLTVDVHKHQASLDNDRKLADKVQVGGEPG